MRFERLTRYPTAGDQVDIQDADHEIVVVTLHNAVRR
jgi:hypothetical protein